MSGPWEDYGGAKVAADGPWTEYVAPPRKKKPSTASDMAQSYVSGVREAVSSGVDALVSMTPLGVAGRMAPGNPLGLPNPLNALTQGVTSRLGRPLAYTPQTRAGQAARTAGNATVNALAPGSAVARVANVVGPTIGAEVAAEGARMAGAGRQGQDIARTVGGVAGAGVASVRPNALRSRAPGPMEVLADRARPDANALTARAQEYRAAGVQPTLTDVVGDRGRRVIRAVGVRSEEGGEALATRAVEASAATKPAVMARTRRLVDEPRTASQYADDTEAARDAAATRNYGEFDGEPIEVPDAVKDMLADSSGRSIIARARADAIENQDWMRQAELDSLLRPTENGQLPRISAGTIDRLVIAARERGRGFAETGRNYRARGAFQRRDQLDATLDGVEELQPARQAYSEQSRAIEVARDENRLDPFSTDPADYAAWLGGLPEEAQRANMIAIRQEILDTLGGQRASSFGTLDEIATSPYARDNLRAAFGPEQADQLINEARLRLAQTRNASMVSPNGGSRTAVLDNDVDNTAQNVVAAGTSIGTGNVLPLAARAIDAWRRRGVTQEQAEQIARIAVDPNQTDAAIQQIAARLAPGVRQEFLQLRNAALVGGGVAVTGFREPEGDRGQQPR